MVHDRGNVRENLLLALDTLRTHKFRSLLTILGVLIGTTTVIVSGLMMSPDLSPAVIGTILTILGVAGLRYLVSSGAHAQWRLNRMLRIDWLWFVGAPILSYALLFAAGIGIWMQAIAGMYGVEAAVLLSLVTGIRNAWDVVLWIAEQPRA